jgi:O-antigen/teichoic acid export membrane protein
MVSALVSAHPLEVVVSRSYRIGLLVLGALSALDLALPLLTDGEHPPMPVALAAAALGLASLVLVVSAWRGARRAVLPLVVLRALSALAAIPALFTADVPAPMLVTAALLLAFTAAGIGLTLTGRQHVQGGAR